MDHTWFIVEPGSKVEISYEVSKPCLFKIDQDPAKSFVQSKTLQTRTQRLIAMAADEGKARLCIFHREGANNSNFPSHCSYGPAGDDPFRWQAAIMGPTGTPYEDGVFFLSIKLPNNYPYSPPLIKFLTKVYHPNIGEDGKVYMDILEEEGWRPVFCMETIILSLCSLLADPNPVDPSNPSSLVYREDVQKFNRIARKWTVDYAI